MQLNSIMFVYVFAAYDACECLKSPEMALSPQIIHMWVHVNISNLRRVTGSAILGTVDWNNK